MHPLLYVVLIFVAAACASKKDQDHTHDRDESAWEEMDDFHIIMAESFHPFKDSANLEPAKARASTLMTAANDWASAPLPERVNNDTMRSKLEALKEQATTLAETVKSQDDNAIGEQLTKLHDIFHEIEHTWYEKD